jgi:hypothetical protein
MMGSQLMSLRLLLLYHQVYVIISTISSLVVLTQAFPGYSQRGSNHNTSDVLLCGVYYVVWGKVARELTEQESLLDLALKVVIEALRINPDRYKIIYDRNMTTMTISFTAIPHLHQCLLLLYLKITITINIVKYFRDSKRFPKDLVKSTVDKTMVVAVKEK